MLKIESHRSGPIPDASENTLAYLLDTVDPQRLDTSLGFPRDESYLHPMHQNPFHCPIMEDTKRERTYIPILPYTVTTLP